MSPRKLKKELLTTSEVADLLYVHINTVRRWSNKGILKAVRIGPRGDRRFRREDIQNLLADFKEVQEVETWEQGGNGEDEQTRGNGNK